MAEWLKAPVRKTGERFAPRQFESGRVLHPRAGAWGEDFHLYREIFDEDHVYLELDTTHFEAGYGRVMIPIPIHIWETVRHLGGARLDLVDLLDEDLLVKVQRSGVTNGGT